MKYVLTVNGTRRAVEAEPDTPLLWVLRDAVGVKGTKFGCGAGLCGACTVHIHDQAVRSCQMPVSAVGAAPIVTIEGLEAHRGGHVQAAWIAEQASQCGYCQPGMIMAAAALLKTTPFPTDEDIDREITNICRCGGYSPIRRAIHRAAAAKTKA